MSLEKQTPIIPELDAITPSVASARGPELSYDGLEPIVVGKWEEQPDGTKVWKDGPASKKYESANMAAFWNEDKDSLAERRAARKLATQYMLMGAHALQQAGTSDAKQLWSERYTDSTTDIYGLPNADLARQLWIEQQEGSSPEQLFESAAEQVSTYFDATYASVYEALGINDAPDRIEPAEIADRFEAALRILVGEYDSMWEEWSIERDETKDSLSVSGPRKKIIIGMNRAPVTPDQLKALFSHEVLVHALRPLNGQKIADELRVGLPGYLDTEEGLGVFVEYALSGTVPEKNVDRYIDIAYALGVIDGQQHTRQELIDHAMVRSIKRSEERGDNKTSESIEKEVYAHINRIYRGSLGNEYIGIYAKDIMYHRGFLEMGKFISQRLEDGETVDELMEYLLQARFDPTNPQHVAYLNEAKQAA